MLVHSQALSTKVNFLKSLIPSFPSTIGLTSAVAIHQKCRCIKIGTFDEIGKKSMAKKSLNAILALPIAGSLLAIVD